MSHFLQSLLGVGDDNRVFRTGLAKLEKMTGNSGVDIRLIADIIENGHNVMRKLGLDINDTTARELYFTLNSAVRRDCIEWTLADTDYVLMVIDDEIVSLNMIDVIENAHHELKFERRIISHGQRSLRGELVWRYVEHARTDETSTREVAKTMGLLPESDACYTDNKHKKKMVGTSPEESKK